MKKEIAAVLALCVFIAALSSCGLIRINGPHGGRESDAVTEPVGTETENSDREYEKVINDIAIRAKQYLSTIEDADLIIVVRDGRIVETGTHDSLAEASIFVETIEKRTGLKIACLESIAWENGWITSEDLVRLAEPMIKNQYGQYLLKLASE